jgi:hypothetical protein
MGTNLDFLLCEQAIKWGKITGEAGTAVATAVVSATVASTANSTVASVTAAVKPAAIVDGMSEQAAAAAAVNGVVQVPAHLAFVLRATKTLTEHLPVLWKLGEFHLQHAIPEFPCVFCPFVCEKKVGVFFLHW